MKHRKIHKILLIESQPPGFHVFSRFKMPRLGLPILAALLRRQGYDVRIHLGAWSQDNFRQHDDCDLVGFSTTTSTAPEAYRLADLFRSAGKTVVIGGVHATFLPEEALAHADFVVRGEAEDTFPELLRRLNHDELPNDLPGLSYRLASGFVHAPDAPWIEDLDRLPFPDFSLQTTKIELYDIPLQTSRGCPYPCNFCSVTSMFGRKVRLRSVDSVLAELRQIPKPEVFFYDDNFCAKPQHTKALLTAMLREGINLKYFSAQVRADIARDPELMDLMYRAGCRQVYVGFESINPESLKAYDKRQTVEEVRSSMEVFRRFKMRVHGMFVIGSDHDGIQTAAETHHFAREHGIDTVQFMMLTPIPGTELYRELEAANRLLTHDWSLFDAHHAVFLPQKMTPLQLQRSTIRAMSRFYSAGRGFLELLRGNTYRASRCLMGWYILRRWRWDNRHWSARLRALSQESRKARLQKRLDEVRGQLEGMIRGVQNRWAQMPADAENLLHQAEAHMQLVGRLAGELITAVERDLSAIENRLEAIAAEALHLQARLKPGLPQ